MVARRDGKPRTFDPVKKKARFVEKARRVHGDKYLYPDDYLDCKKPIKIVCQVHGEFTQTPDAHIRGRGCSKCRVNKGGISYKNEEVIERFTEVHGCKYDYTSVSYVGANTKVEIKCRQHGSFYQTPASHLSGSGCPYCAGKQRTEKDFIELFQKKGVDGVAYIEGFVNMGTPCTFHCTKHGSFSTKPSTYLDSKHGCKVCADENTGKALAKGLEEIVKSVEATGRFQVISVDNDGHYSYNSKSKVTVKCVKHGLIETRTYQTLIDSVGCSRCLTEHKSSQRSHTREKFVQLALGVHGNEYDYSCVEYVRSSKPVKVVCPEHGKFVVTPNRHLAGQKCPKCTVKSNWSREGFIDYANSNYEGLATIYFIRCFDDVESFVKVGRTCRTLKERFKTKQQMPYGYEVLFQLKLCAAKVYDLEKEVKRVFKTGNYLPQKDFGGKTECFKIDNQVEIFNFIKEYL